MAAGRTRRLLKPMKLTVVRHGETTHNARKILMGQRHGNLSPKGKKQVQALGKGLKNKEFDFIYCSDLKRCKDTLREISKYHKHVPVVFTKDLRERSMGIFEGKPHEELHKAFEKYKAHHWTFKPNGGESYEELKARVLRFLNYVKKNHPQDRVLLVTHGGVLRSIASILRKTSLEKLFKTVTFGNAAICEYEISKGKVKVLSFNDISHL